MTFPSQYVHRLGLFNDMAFKILDRLGCKNPTEEQIRSIESVLNKFIIIPFPRYDQLKINFCNRLNNFKKSEKLYSRYTKIFQENSEISYIDKRVGKI